MANYMYWTSDLLFVLVLTIIYFIDSKTSEPHRTKLEKSYCLMMAWVIFFCLQDCFWGLCSSGIISNDKIFFLSSQVFHISTVLSTFFWFYYILNFLGDRVKFGKVYLAIDIAFIIFEIVLVTINFFKPVLFTISNGTYVKAFFRPLTFFNQYIVYLTIGVVTLLCTFNEKSKTRNSFFTVFIFSLAPILLGVFQLMYPDGPFYSIGYFLGGFIVHIFLVAKDRSEKMQVQVLSNFKKIYYSMHIFDLKDNTAKRILESPILQKIIGNITDAQTMIDTVMKETICEEYLDMILSFSDLSTLSDRLANKSNIQCECVGRNYGWTRFCFVPIEYENNTLTKVALTTQIIDEEKKQQIELLFKSNHDEMTGLYNRRAYDDEISKKKTLPLEKNLVYVSMDLNGLKNSNDTLGHAAGDELLKGAAMCMKQCLALYGKVFRIGGDEFCALLYADRKIAKIIRDDFEERISAWTGELNKSLSIACGWVAACDSEKLSINDIADLADRRMYQDKNIYYQTHLKERRESDEMYTALHSLYTKILKVNITKDTYEILSMDEKEQKKNRGYETTMSTWLQNFADTGQIHPDDVESYLLNTNLSRLREYFSITQKPLNIFYRRKIGKKFKNVVMDLVPAADFSKTNQSLFLYVKDIEKN